MGNFVEAAECLTKVLKEENVEILRVGLWTKIAGNYKKADDKDKTLHASKQAWQIMLRLQGAKDPQTCRCKLNLAQVHQHFENPDEAKKLYNEYLELFRKQDGSDGTENWADNPTYAKMRDFAEAQIAEIDQVDEGGEEYYDEEDDGAAEANGEDEEDEAPEPVPEQ